MTVKIIFIIIVNSNKDINSGQLPMIQVDRQ